MNEAAPVFAGDRIDDRARPSPKGLLSRPAVYGTFIPIVTILNAGVGMVLPKMMAPRMFGEYSLIATLFSYGVIFDLGVSQIIDRRIPAYLGSGQPDLARRTGDQLLWLRLAIAAITFLMAGGVLLALATENSLPFGLSSGLFAVLAGIAYMVANGPPSINRARSERRDYAVRITILLSGLIFARLGGLMAGGLAGCYAALSVWYITCAALFHRRSPLDISERPGIQASLSLIARGIPFFTTAIIWAFYVTGNRWFASLLIEPEQFGQFAFSANIFALIVGAAGGFSAFYYPKLVERIAGSGDYAVSAVLTRDLSGLMALICGGMAIGILLAGFLIRVIYPQYVQGTETARIILVAVPPMALASWLMPISLSAGQRPLVDGLVIFPLATAVLGAAIYFLYGEFGAEGAAWASTVSALPLIGMQLVAIHHARILRARGALIVFGVSVAGCAALGLLAWRMTN